MSTNPLMVAWCISAAASLAYTLYRLNARRIRGPLFPQLDETRVRFHEKSASGRSLENLLTKIGGARNCLKITVTEDELWVTLWYPLSFFADVYDLEHRIKFTDIVSMTEVKNILIGQALIVEFRRADGRLARLELAPKRYEEFKRAMETGMNAG